jgi:hypothetical protein
MAGVAGVLVVRLGVAAPADRVAGKVEGPGVARECDSRVAGDAVDPFGYVGAMLERVRLRRCFEAEYSGARGERERED